ncbi:MAG: hypothetical protein BMS9Abin26_0633 [Gammaproteobacteria bacterium]|nr:MAG: hypothetical protein BMS9Abin26_0633 [Gammaproteobacteria bacterium]
MATILYFGSLPDIIRKTRENIILAGSINNVGDLLAHIRKRGDKWQEVMDLKYVQVTVNRQFANEGTAVSNDDEIAIISIGLLK